VKGEEEWEVKKILNKRRIREKDKYLVHRRDSRQKGTHGRIRKI